MLWAFIMVKKFRMNFTIFVNFIIIGSLLSIHANSQETYFDLSQDEIQIRTNFDGKEIIIFGLLEDDHDTILAIRGPSKKLKIQKKERYFGVWFILSHNGTMPQITTYKSLLFNEIELL